MRRQIRGAAAGQAVNPQRGEHLGDPTPALRPRQLLNLERVADVLGDGEPRPQCQILEHHPRASLVQEAARQRGGLQNRSRRDRDVSRPDTRRARVVLPAPGGPSTYVISPGRSSSEAPSTAARPPNRFSRRSRMTRIIAGRGPFTGGRTGASRPSATRRYRCRAQAVHSSRSQARNRPSRQSRPSAACASSESSARSTDRAGESQLRSSQARAGGSGATSAAERLDQAPSPLALAAQILGDRRGRPRRRLDQPLDRLVLCRQARSIARTADPELVLRIDQRRSQEIGDQRAYFRCRQLLFRGRDREGMPGRSADAIARCRLLNEPAVTFTPSRRGKLVDRRSERIRIAPRVGPGAFRSERARWMSLCAKRSDDVPRAACRKPEAQPPRPALRSACGVVGRSKWG